MVITLVRTGWILLRWQYILFSTYFTLKLKDGMFFLYFSVKKERKNACIFGLLLTNHEGLLTPLSP